MGPSGRNTKDEDMNRRHLKNSTALAMSALIALPAPVFAAGHIPLCVEDGDTMCLNEAAALVIDGDVEGLPDCGPDTELPCVTAEGFRAIDPESPEAAEAMAEADMDGDTEMAEGDVTVEADGSSEMEDEMAEGVADEAMEESADMSDPQMDAEDIAEEMPEAEEAEMAESVEDDTTTETVEAEAGISAEDTTAEEDTAALEQALAQTSGEDGEDGDAEAMAEASGDDGEAMAEAEGEAETMAGGDGEVVQIGEDGGSDASEELVQTEEPADDDSPMTDATDDASEAEIAAEAAPETLDESAVNASNEGVESEPVDGNTPAGAGDEAMAEAEAEVSDEASTAAAAAETEAPATAAATAEGDATAEVETEEVTEDSSRSSAEDFETAAVGNEGGAVMAESDTAAGSGDGDSGLSNFEKALLLGLGAAAVGSILNNGDEVVSNSGDRIVVRRDGELQVLKNDDALLRQPGAQVRTETFDDGSTRTTVTRQDGTQIITIRAADGRVLRRVRVFDDGTQVTLFDDTQEVEEVDVTALPQQQEQESVSLAEADEEALRRALNASMVRDTGRRYSLRQVRQIQEVRALAPEIELDSVTFQTGSAAIQPSQAEELTALGRAMNDLIDENPGEVFLVEGHTDTVGDATMNLALSDRRAETVALALTEYFDVPPENMITQGYGEAQLKVEQEGDIRANRRATVRRITPLLASN